MISNRSNTQFKGIYERKQGGFTATISFNGNRMYLGVFKTIDEAIQKRENIKKELGIVDDIRSKKEKEKDYRKENRKKLDKTIDNWRQRNKDKVRSYKSKYREINRDKILEKRRNDRIQDKIDVINFYGGKCERCGIKTMDFLTIEHSNNDGAEHRKELGIKAGVHFYHWIKKNNYPQDLGLIVLCYNCNCSREPISNTKAAIYARERRKLVIENLGNKCGCCEETNYNLLTIDHINNDGNIDKKGCGLINKIIKENYPKDKYRILCWNCNCGRQYSPYKTCPHNYVKDIK